MTRPDEMLAHIIDAMLERNPNLPPEAVEDIIMGCGNPEGAQGHNIGRNAAVLSKLPMTTGGTTINRYCSCTRCHNLMVTFAIVMKYIVLLHPILQLTCQMTH